MEAGDLNVSFLFQILADAMGLGKTVMTISLILGNPGRGGMDINKVAIRSQFTKWSSIVSARGIQYSINQSDQGFKKVKKQCTTWRWHTHCLSYDPTWPVAGEISDKPSKSFFHMQTWGFMLTMIVHVALLSIGACLQ